jgi:acetyl esterase
MPLKAQALAVLERLGMDGGPPLQQQRPVDARLDAYRFVDLFGPPEPVADVSYRFIPGPTADLPVRVYRPSDDSALPGLVYFHGSGFVISNIGIFDSPSRALANRTGCVVVSVNYQKAPEHKFPVPFDDAYAATTWVQDHAADFGIDPARVGVIGDSSGGTLATAVCLKARDELAPKLSLQVLVHPPTQFGIDTPSMVENSEGMLLESAGMRWFAEQYLRSADDALNAYAAPMRASSLQGLPPALVVTAEYDPLRDEGEQYAERLRLDGVPVTVSRYEGMIHGFYGMTAVLDAANDLFDEIARFVRPLMGLESPARSVTTRI